MANDYGEESDNWIPKASHLITHPFLYLATLVNKYIFNKMDGLHICGCVHYPCETQWNGNVQ